MFNTGLISKTLFSRQARQDRKENHNSLYLNERLDFLALFASLREKTMFAV
jgi:hypothetical protein